jgi:hemolysin III
MAKSSIIREPGNFYTHIIPAILGIPAGYLLLLKADSPSEIFSSLIYTFCFVALFTASALYHAVPKTPEAIKQWRKVDHASIYFMIAGTYTPTLIGLYDGWFMWTMLILQWSIVIFGVSSKISGKLMHHKQSLILYLAMGWMVMLGINTLITKLPQTALMLLFGGGAFYSFGAWIYHLDKQKPNKGFHELWHLFVIGGAVCHYFYTYLYLI